MIQHTLVEWHTCCDTGAKGLAWIIQDVCSKKNVTPLSTVFAPGHLLGAHSRPLQGIKIMLTSLCCAA